MFCLTFAVDLAVFLSLSGRLQTLATFCTSEAVPMPRLWGERKSCWSLPSSEIIRLVNLKHNSWFWFFTADNCRYFLAHMSSTTFTALCPVTSPAINQAMCESTCDQWREAANCHSSCEQRSSVTHWCSSSEPNILMTSSTVNLWQQQLPGPRCPDSPVGLTLAFGKPQSKHCERTGFAFSH